MYQWGHVNTSLFMLLSFLFLISNYLKIPAIKKYCSLLGF